MPGGVMEWGESPEATAVRELEEETGLKATIGPVLGVLSQWITEPESVRGGTGHHLGIVYEGSDLVGQTRTSFD